MKTKPIVALVGRPNVGKSRLFNRLVGQRISIVHDQPGVTRDIVSHDVNNHYELLDTGGLGITSEMDSKAMAKAVEDQVDFAIQAADLILFVTDGPCGCTAADKMVADKLRSKNKSVIVVVNKLDDPMHEAFIDSFYELGLSNVVGVSAEHKQGISDLKKLIEDHIGLASRQSNEELPKRIHISFVGRPNVGKSSIVNSILKSDRLIVSDVAGTTRDAIGANFDFVTQDNQTHLFHLVDTAGLKMRKKLDSSVDFFSAIRSEKAINESDVVFLVMDALAGVTKFEKKLIGQIIEAGKCVVVIVNKWDLAVERFKKDPPQGYENIATFKESYKKAIRSELYELPVSPIIFVSALQKLNLNEILYSAHQVYSDAHKKVSTSHINQVLGDLTDQRKHPSISGKRFKIYYAVQTRQHPFTIRIYCNDPARLEEGYKRYLLHGFYEAFNLTGCPILLQLIGKTHRSHESSSKEH